MKHPFSRSIHTKRESGANPERSGHCMKGIGAICHCSKCCEKAAQVMIFESGNLLFM